MRKQASPYKIKKMIKTMVVLASFFSLFGCGAPGNTSGRVNENDTIVHFSLNEGGGMDRFSGFGYLVEETQDGKVHFLFNEGYPDEKELTIEDHSVFDALQAIIMNHKVYKYQDHYQPVFDVLDGTSWGLYVSYASGKDISTGGYMAGPSGYRDAINDFIQCLDSWKEQATIACEVVSFHYEYGSDVYDLERKDDRMVMTVFNKDSGKRQVLDRELELLDQLRILFNVYRLKMNQIRENLDFEYTPWMFEITYNNGAKYHYESYDTTFKCGYTEALQDFMSHCMKEKEDRDQFYYYY